MAVHRAALGIAALAAVPTLLLPGCTADSAHLAGTTADSAHLAGTTADSAHLAGTTATTSTRGPEPTAGPRGVLGSGCAGYAQRVPSGPGSLTGMAADPVTVAMSNSPELTTLSGAFAGKLNPEVNLTNTLSRDRHTVFAPTDEAFGRLAPAVLDTLRHQAADLAALLSYHVVLGDLDPASIVGVQKTLQGQSVTVTSSPDGLRVNDARVVCGAIRTADATIYLLDTVLIPPASATPAPGPTPTP